MCVRACVYVNAPIGLHEFQSRKIAVDASNLSEPVFDRTAVINVVHYIQPGASQNRGN